MVFIEKISALNSIIVQLQLPENHILLGYQRNSYAYDADSFRAVFFYQNYFSLLQQYFYQSSSYIELMIFTNIEGEMGDDLRYDVRPNYYMLGYNINEKITEKVIEIKDLIKKLKNAGVPIDEIEANFNIFEQYAENHREEIFQLHFLEVIQAELTLHAPSDEEQHEEIEEAGIFNIIALCFTSIVNYICTNSAKVSTGSCQDSNMPTNIEEFDPNPDCGGRDSSFFSVFPFK